MITLLLPPRERFGGQRLSADTGRALARGDCTQRSGDALSNIFMTAPQRNGNLVEDWSDEDEEVGGGGDGEALGGEAEQ